MGNKREDVVKKDYFYIYEITNKLNNKKYIGQHSTNNMKDGYFGSGTLLDVAIKKYGKESFEMEIIEYCEDYQDLQDREEFYVNQDVVESDEYYNLVLGGGLYGSGGFKGRLVIVYETFYRSIAEAAHKYGITRKQVAERCLFEEWVDWEFYDEALKKEPYRVKSIIDPLNPYNKVRLYSNSMDDV